MKSLVNVLLLNIHQVLPQSMIKFAEPSVDDLVSSWRNCTPYMCILSPMSYMYYWNVSLPGGCLVWRDINVPPSDSKWNAQPCYDDVLVGRRESSNRNYIQSYFTESNPIPRDPIGKVITHFWSVWCYLYCTCSDKVLVTGIWAWVHGLDVHLFSLLPHYTLCGKF